MKPSQKIGTGELHRALHLTKQRAFYWRRHGLLPKQHGLGRGAYYVRGEIFRHLESILSERRKELELLLKAYVETKRKIET